MNSNYNNSVPNLRNPNLTLQHGVICSAINQVFAKAEANDADALFRNWINSTTL